MCFPAATKAADVLHVHAKRDVPLQFFPVELSLQETPCRPPSAPAVKRQQMTMGEDDDVLVDYDVLEKMMMFL